MDCDKQKICGEVELTIALDLFFVVKPITVASIAVRLNGFDRIAGVADKFIACFAIGVAVLAGQIVAENAVAVGNKTDSGFLLAHSAGSGASFF